MPNTTSLRLLRLKDTIMDKWVERALDEVGAAYHQEDLALRNSLPEYLEHMASALSTTVKRTEVRRLFDKKEGTRIGKKHGQERAVSFSYSMDQVIYEYHILRQVIFDLMEDEAPLSDVEREIIVCSVEQAVNDAATQYSETLRDIQEQLTQTLAHDLRNPLQVAKLNLQLMLRRPDDVENVMNKTSRASVSLDRLDKMIMDLLDASRMKAGLKLSLELRPNCDLNWIIREVAADLNITYDNKILVESKGSCLGNWNESGLRRLVENLASNAIKYGEPGAPVTLSLSESAGMAVLSVHNQGEPIPQDEIPLLFQQFRRARGAEQKLGWGLGLVVVKGMAEAHQGTVEVVSEKGVGTTFTVKLPKVPK
jgi:signal transduction histidine kinase